MCYKGGFGAYNGNEFVLVHDAFEAKPSVGPIPEAYRMASALNCFGRGTQQKQISYNFPTPNASCLIVRLLKVM